MRWIIIALLALTIGAFTVSAETMKFYVMAEGPAVIHDLMNSYWTTCAVAQDNFATAEAVTTDGGSDAAHIAHYIRFRNKDKSLTLPAELLGFRLYEDGSVNIAKKVGADQPEYWLLRGGPQPTTWTGVINEGEAPTTITIYSEKAIQDKVPEAVAFMEKYKLGRTFTAADRTPAAFEDVTAAFGMDGVGKGHAAWIDVDGDGWVDMQEDAGIWRNVNGETFEKSGPGGLCNAWGDMDSDGKLDYFVTVGVAKFANEDGSWADSHLQDIPHICSDASTILDIDGDGLLDIYLGGYEMEWVYQPDSIYRNLGDRKFGQIWKTDGRAQPTRGVSPCDFDMDGDTDIYVTHYRLEPNILWVNDGTGKFTNGAPTYNATGGNGHGIGSAWGDVDDDGYIDIFAGNFAHGGQPESRFLRNLGPAGNFHFEDKGTCGVNYQESYASPALGDFDNDGDLDLMFTTVYRHNHPALFRNDTDGSKTIQFTNVTDSAGVGGLPGTMQAAWCDFDNDGDLDLMAGGKLFRNKGNENNWLKVKLEGSSSVNRAAIGAQVRIKIAGRTLTRHVESSTGSGNVNDMTLHFGVGTYDGPLELEIAWPYRGIQKTTVDAVNQTVTIQAPTEGLQAYE